MAQIIDTTKTVPCENCGGKGLDPASVSPAPFNPTAGERITNDQGEVVEIIPAVPLKFTKPEGCAPCGGTGQVLADDAVLFETDDLKKLVRESHKKYADQPGVAIVGVDSTDLPDIEHKPKE
jgi:hypothetical protein